MEESEDKKQRAFYNALVNNDVEEVRSLLLSGIEPSRVVYFGLTPIYDSNQSKYVDTLHVSQHDLPKHQIAELLLAHGAAFSSEESKESFLTKIWMMVNNEGFDFESSYKKYMPLLEILASYKILDIKTINCFKGGFTEEAKKGLIAKIISSADIKSSSR